MWHRAATIPPRRFRTIAQACAGIGCPRRGIITVWVALVLVALCMLAAMAVDAGQVAVIRARLQAAADAGALAAALAGENIYQVAAEYCRDNLMPSTDAEITLQSSDGDTYTYTVGPYTIVVTSPYSDCWTEERGYDPSELVYVSVTRQVQPFFGSLGGRGPVSVSATSLARRLVSGTALPAIFAGETDPDEYGFWWTGSGGVVQGDVTSNSRVKLTGSGHTVHGTVYYVSRKQVTGSGHQIDGGFVKMSSTQDWPVELEPSDLEPYDYYISGDYKVSGSGVTIPPGVYYVTGDVKISGSGITAEGVTFIAEGKIHVSGSGHTFTPAREQVLFFAISNKTWTIDISGSGGTWEGLCYAPNGSITFTGSGHFVQEGSLVAREVKITGSGFEIYPTTGGSSSHVSAKLIR